MNIYTFSPSYDARGFNTHREIHVQNPNGETDQLREAIANGGTVAMAWDHSKYDWCPDGLPEGTLLLGPLSGFIGKKAIFEKMHQLMTPNRGVAKLTGLGDEYVLVAPLNIKDPDTAKGLPHLLMAFPKYGGLVTERFKDEWERQGYTGAAFKKVMELRDSQFVPIPEQR